MRRFFRTIVFISVLVSGHPSIAQDSLWNVIRQNPKDTLAVRAYTRLSVIYLRNSYDSALYFARKANRLAVELGDDVGEANSLMRMANAFNFMAAYDSAEAAYLKVLDIYTAQNDPLNQGKVYNNLGLMYRYRSDYPKSLEYFMKSFDIKKKYGTPVDVGVANQNIGIIFAIQGEYATAESYLQDAIIAFREGGDSVKYYSSMMDMSSMYREQGKHEQAIDYLQKSYEYNKRMGRTTEMGVAIYNMGSSSYLNSDFTKAIEYFEEAKTLFTQLGNKVRISGCNIRLATIYHELGLQSKAEKIAKEGLELLHDLSSPTQYYTLLETMSDILAAQNRYKEAYFYRMRFEHIRDSIVNEEHDLKMVELEGKYKQEIDKREIAELTAANKQSQLIARKKKIQSSILSGVIVVVLLIAIMLYSRAKNKKKINDALRDKNKVIQHSLEEKEVLLREIHHRVQNNLQFVTSLLNLQSRRVDDEKTLEILKQCRLRIQSMALVHQKLYQENSLQGIDFNSYTRNLIDTLFTSYDIRQERIRTEVDVDDVALDINTAIPVGLIINELITNCVKYAFPDGQAGEIHISLKMIEGHLQLTVRDNGVGLPDDFGQEASLSFGIKLIRSLAQKLKGELDFRNDNGTVVTLRIAEFEQA